MWKPSAFAGLPCSRARFPRRQFSEGGGAEESGWGWEPARCGLGRRLASADPPTSELRSGERSLSTYSKGPAFDRVAVTHSLAAGCFPRGGWALPAVR